LKRDGVDGGVCIGNLLSLIGGGGGFLPPLFLFFGTDRQSEYSIWSWCLPLPAQIYDQLFNINFHRSYRNYKMDGLVVQSCLLTKPSGALHLVLLFLSSYGQMYFLPW
jgi:hypothetical protein